MKQIPQKSNRLELARSQHAAGNLSQGLNQEGRRFINVEHLVPDPKNERKTFTGIDELAASLKEVGQLEPLIVTPYTDGRYLIIAGHRRYQAAPVAGLSKLEVIVRADVSDEQRAIRGITSNLQREDTPPIERAQHLKALIESFGFTQEELASKLGKDKTWISAMLRILELPAPLLEKLGAPNFSPSSDTVIRIARINDPAFQAQLVESLIHGAPQKEIRALIKTHKDEKAGSKTEPTAPKPKFVFHTEHGADVIVQSKKARLTLDERIAALQEALRQAKTSQQ